MSEFVDVTASGNNPAYLIVAGLDRDRYTITSTGATGSFSGNGHTATLTRLGGDERGAGIVFTWNAATGQYVNSVYGNLTSLSYTASGSPNDLTAISLFGTSSLTYANTYAPYADSMAATPSVFTAIGTVAIATQPGFTGTVPAQATPDSIAATARTFVGATWNDNGCWVLANTIAAEAGAALPATSNVLRSGSTNGEWRVAYNGAVSANTNWQSLVHTGEVIAFIWGGSNGHVTTCVSGSGATAMLIDNVSYGSGNAAHDGSPDDLIIAGPHAAVGEWSMNVLAKDVVIYELDTPIVTASVSNYTLRLASSLSLSSVFTAADPFGTAITQYQAYESTTIDTLSINGVVVKTALSAASAATAGTLSAFTIIGAAAGSYAVTVRAYNGSYWGDWRSLAITSTGAAPPVLAKQTAAQSAYAGHAVSFAITSGTFTDPQGQALTLSATLANGTALPSWLTFNPSTGTFAGTSPLTPQITSLKVTATNTSGVAISETVALTTTADTPMLVSQTATDTVYNNTAFTLALPATTFTDPLRETLTYSATLADGTHLPSWMTFNASTRTFSGIAPSTAQTLSIRVTATNTDGVSASETFSFVNKAASAPVLVTRTAAQSFYARHAVSFTVPLSTFKDPQNESLTYSATLTSGISLPSWLSFNPATGAFTGTAPPTAQNVSLRVTATDTSGVSASETVALTIAAVPPPKLTSQTAAQSAFDNIAFSFSLAAKTFTDPLNETLTYTAAIVDSLSSTGTGPLPSWLSFNARTMAFTGTAPATAGTQIFRVAATNTDGVSATETFAFTTKAAAAPTIRTVTAAQTFYEGQAVSFTVPPASFADPQGQTIKLSAAISGSDGHTTALPSWLRFNATTGAFTGTAPSTGPQTLSVLVTATDVSGAATTETVSLTLRLPAAPVTTASTAAYTIWAGTTFNLTPGTSFSGPPGGRLTFSAALRNGGNATSLPSWLTVNATTGALTGTGSMSAAGSFTIVETATDAFGQSASKVVTITEKSQPVLRTQTPGQTWTCGQAVSLRLPSNTFTDPLGETLTYTATLVSGAALPSGLAFNTTTGTFSGTAPITPVTLGIKVTATNTDGAFITESFNATIKAGAPTVIPPAAQRLTDGQAFSLNICETFSDPQGAPLVFSAHEIMGADITSWLHFNSTTGILSGMAPMIGSGTAGIRIVATDRYGMKATETFGVAYGPSGTTLTPPTLTNTSAGTENLLLHVG